MLRCLFYLDANDANDANDTKAADDRLTCTANLTTETTHLLSAVGQASGYAGPPERPATSIVALLDLVQMAGSNQDLSLSLSFVAGRMHAAR